MPRRKSFAEFLANDARVPCSGGRHDGYSFKGREALKAVVEVIDGILGNGVEQRRNEETKNSQSAIANSRIEDRTDGETFNHRGSGTGIHLPTSNIEEKAESRKQKTALPDAQLSLAGGAQFGKTILELNLAAYCTSQLFRNFGLYLPDDDLVEGIVDSKFRPDVVDQIGWFAEMAQVGKALNKSGKAVNRKGAFLVTDGARKAVGMIRGLGKVPTTFSMDIAMMDEVDDIEPKMMKFVRGRLTASDLRFIMKIGTQRVHGRGMNKAWKDGSRGVFVFKCAKCGRRHCAEGEFPQIIRLKAEATFNIQHSTSNIEGSHGSAVNCKSGSATVPVAVFGVSPKTSRSDSDNPQLSWSGEFEARNKEINQCSTEVSATLANRPTVQKWEHHPSNEYYLGCVACGAELDRTKPIEEHRQPERIQQRHWSFRISQLSIAAIDLQQIVGRFQLAVADPEEMTVFRCDVLGLPHSTSQSLTPSILERARAVETFDMTSKVREGCVGVGGLDMGDRCWMFAREIVGGTSYASPHITDKIISGTRVTRPSECRRLLHAEKISAGDVVGRTIQLFHQMGLSALLVDERPLVNEARTIALALNGLQDLAQWPRVPDARDAYVTLPGGLTWDGRNSRWLNLKCAVVRFTKTKLGAGIQQSIVFFEEGGQTKFVPCIECNRFETIDRVVREFLTPEEGVIDVLSEGRAPRDPNQGVAELRPPKIMQEPRPTIRQMPMMLLPRMDSGHAPILDTVEAHLITGSEREKLPDGSLGDYVDGCENHFLLADGYSKLAEIICATNNRREKFAYEKVEIKGRQKGLI
jgi:hypothetical protein